MRSTATGMSRKGASGSPVESYGQPRHPGCDRQRDVPGNAGGVWRKAGLEIGIHRKIGRRDHLPQVQQHFFDGHLSVRLALPPRGTGTRGGQCLEAESFQVTGAARVPGVRDHEAARNVQLAEGPPPGGDVAEFGHGDLQQR